MNDKRGEDSSNRRMIPRGTFLLMGQQILIIKTICEKCCNAQFLLKSRNFHTPRWQLNPSKKKKKRVCLPPVQTLRSGYVNVVRNVFQTRWKEQLTMISRHTEPLGNISAGWNISHCTRHGLLGIDFPWWTYKEKKYTPQHRIRRPIVAFNAKKNFRSCSFVWVVVRNPRTKTENGRQISHLRCVVVFCTDKRRPPRRMISDWLQNRRMPARAPKFVLFGDTLLFSFCV